MCVLSCLTLCHPMNCSSPASLSMEFSRQEYWSGLPFSPPGDVPDPQIIPESPVSPAQERGFFTTEPRGLSCCPSKKTPEHMCPATSRYRVTRWTPGARKWGITWDQPCSHFDYGLRKWTLVVKTPSLWDFRGGPMIKTALPLQGASIWYLVGKLRSRVPHLWNSVLAPGFPTDSGSKESAHNAGDVGSIPESGRSPGGGNGNPFHQYSCLENSMDRGAWRTTVQGIAKNWTTNTFTFCGNTNQTKTSPLSK